jgi:hypothetical protein
MSSAIRNPALEAFVEAMPPEFPFGQILISTSDGQSFVMTHVEDRNAPSLRNLTVPELRRMAQFTADGQFRPLRSAPSLQRGWRFVAADPATLDAGLNSVYPGAIADWFAAHQLHPPTTSYRDFTNRQSGMYRITTHLSEARAAAVAVAGCAAGFCLKRRLWTVEGLPADSIEGKSPIPCLEPCAVLLEFARTIARTDQQSKQAAALPKMEAQAAATTLEEKLRQPAPVREGDFSAPGNPRRMQLLKNELKPIVGNENT